MFEHKLVEALHKRDVPSAVVSLWDEEADGEVAILGTSIHVQCGDGYFIVTKQLDEETWEHLCEAGNFLLAAVFVSSLVKSEG